MLAKSDPKPALPPGAVVLALSGTDRTDLAGATLLWAAVLLGTGAALGYWYAKRRS